LKVLSPVPRVPEDDNVYMSPAVVLQVLDDLREMRARRRPTRQQLRDSNPCWKCRCRVSKYEDLGDRIRCLACGAEYELSSP